MSHKIASWQSNPSTGQALSPAELHPVPSSLDEATRRLPSGGYTTFRTFQDNRVLRLADHFERLETAARLAGVPVVLNREHVRQDLRAVLNSYPAGEARVRVILELENQPGTIYYLVEALHVPSIQEYEQGVHVVTRQMHRTNPAAKLTRFVETADAVRQQLPPGTNEAVMVGEEGQLLEGLSSNFFAVLKSTVWTASRGVLPGITRSLVMDVIHDLRIPLRMEAVYTQDLAIVEEAFITSASRAVLPVTVIDGHPVGSGQPGLLTRKIQERYAQRVEAELEAI